MNKDNTPQTPGIPEPLMQYIKAQENPKKFQIGFGDIKKPQDFPGVFEYKEGSDKLSQNPSNVKNYVERCLGLVKVFNTSIGGLEFINPESGYRHSRKHVRIEVLGYFVRQWDKDPSRICKTYLESEQDAIRYSPLLIQGYQEPWDGVPRVDKYIDLLEWDPAYEPPVTMKKDGTFMSGQEWKRFALRAWLVNCWKRTECTMSGSSDIPENKMIILCAGGCEDDLAQWVQGLYQPYLNGAMVMTSRLENDASFNKFVTVCPMVYFYGMDRLTKTKNRNSRLNVLLTRNGIDFRDPYSRDFTHYRATSSFIGSAVNYNLAKLADSSPHRVLLHVRRPNTEGLNPHSNTQFWAEVRHLAETAEPEEYSFKPFEPSIRQCNRFA